MSGSTRKDCIMLFKWQTEYISGSSINNIHLTSTTMSGIVQTSKGSLVVSRPVTTFLRCPYLGTINKHTHTHTHTSVPLLHISLSNADTLGSLFQGLFNICTCVWYVWDHRQCLHYSEYPYFRGVCKVRFHCSTITTLSMMKTLKHFTRNVLSTD